MLWSIFSRMTFFRVPSIFSCSSRFFLRLARIVASGVLKSSSSCDSSRRASCSASSSTCWSSLCWIERFRLLMRLLGTTGAWAPDGPAPDELPSTSAGRLVGEVLGEGAAFLPPLPDLDLALLVLGVDEAGRVVLPLPTGALMTTLGFISLTITLGLGSSKLPKISKDNKLHGNCRG